MNYLKIISVKVNTSLAILALALSGCGEGDSANSSQAQAPSPPQRVVTAEDWNRALHSVYEQRGEKETDSDGNISYTALLDGELMHVLRDQFNRSSTFITVESKAIKESGIIIRDSFVVSYVSVIDCSLPEIRLASVYVADRGLLFMNKISVMADGEVVFEQDIPFDQVIQHANNKKVIESYEFTVDSAKHEGLRKIAKAKNAVVRMQGSRKYITLPYEVAFRYGARGTLTTYDKLYAALKDNIPAKCQR